MSMEVGSGFAHKSMEDYKKAIILNNGILSKVGRALGISRGSVCSKIKNHPELQTLVDDMRDGLIDEAVDCLLNQIKDNQSVPASTFVLKTVGRARGWGENQSITINKGRDENEYDLSRLTDKERILLDELTEKIYQPDVIEAETS